MASGVGKWEVVKKGKKQNLSSGSGGKAQDKKPGRRALREANLSQNRKKNTRETRADGSSRDTRLSDLCVINTSAHKQRNAVLIYFINHLTAIEIFFEASWRNAVS